MPAARPILRPARVADVAALATLAHRAYAAAFDHILTAAELAERPESYFAKRFALTLGKVTVLEADGRLAGFAMLSDRHIDMLFLDPDLTGRGLGRLLLSHLEALGAGTLECFAANANARRFYEHLGWRLESAYTRLYLGRDVGFVRYARPDL
jgi:putative acetyltransferase